MSNQIINQWNKWYEKALKRYHLHRIVSIWFDQKNASFGFWVVIFTTITGTPGGTTIVERFLGSPGGEATSGFEDLLMELDKFIISDFDDRQRIDFFKNINSRWIEIDKKAPILPKYTLNVKRPGSTENEIYNCEGKGLSDNSMAFIDYKYIKSDGIITWNGVMVLKFLKMAEFKGFWITNILEDGRFAFGNVHLKAKESHLH